MTVSRMIELLKIEHECMSRGASNDCDRDCARCELVQSDRDLDEMYTNVIDIVQRQMPIKPKSKTRRGSENRIDHFCSACRQILFGHEKYCHNCGQAMKW